MPQSKTYLTVPFAEKDDAKALGAKWDPKKKKWYAPSSAELSLLAKWQESPTSQASTSPKKSVTLGITTFGNHKDLAEPSKEAPPWD